MLSYGSNFKAVLLIFIFFKIKRLLKNAERGPLRAVGGAEGTVATGATFWGGEVTHQAVCVCVYMSLPAPYP